MGQNEQMTGARGMTKVKLIVTVAGLAAIWTGLQSSSDVNRFVEHAKGQANHTVVSAPYHFDVPLLGSAVKEQLEEKRTMTLERIKQEAEKHYVAPVNAVIDPVWKAIPGYNGLEVDVEKTLELAESKLFPDELELVFREVTPKVSLEQLGPHPIYKGNPHKPMVALMINVAWGDEHLEGMLETLRKEQIKATFFFDGMWLRKNVEKAKAILAEGHEVSNHAYSHKDMSKLSRDQAMQEIVKTETLLKNEVGAENHLFAPPSGDYNQATVNIAHELHLKTVLWTFDTIDWKKPEPSTITRRLRSSVEPGSLILMHPTDSSSRALPEMIRIIREKQLAFGTVSDVISPKRVPKVESATQ
jgi:probable sporulation protein (polysaccharide deacetylase family)